jgi:hypothetical protein
MNAIVLVCKTLRWEELDLTHYSWRDAWPLPIGRTEAAHYQIKSLARSVQNSCVQMNMLTIQNEIG